MKKSVFSFCNQKGGVGKTTSAINIAAYVATAGYRTLIIDLDAQANATSGLGLAKPGDESTAYQLLVDNSDPSGIVSDTGIENLSLIPSNAHLAGAELELVSKFGREFALRNQVRRIADRFDYVFIDCPPSLGLLTVNALCASDYILIPLQCEYYAMEGLAQLLNIFNLVQRNLNAGLEIGGVMLTMADFRTNLTQQVIEEIRGYFKEKVFRAVVPRSVKISEAPSFGKPGIFYDPHNKAAKCYLEIGGEFMERFGGTGEEFEARRRQDQDKADRQGNQIKEEAVIQVEAEAKGEQ